MRVYVLTVLLVLALPGVGAIPGLDSGPWGAWIRESAYPGDSATIDGIRIATGSDGRVHLAFTADAPDGIWKSTYYAVRTPTGWKTQELEFRSSVMGLAVDPAGTPHVVTTSHFDDGFVRYWTISPTGATSEIIPAYPQGHSSRMGDLVFDDDGQPHLIDAELELNVGRYSYRDEAGTWHTEIMASNVGESGGIAVIGDVVHVVYTSRTNHVATGMRHAIRDGGVWTNTPVAGCPVAISLAKGTQGDLHVACNLGTPEALGYRHWDGTTWSLEPVDLGPRRGFQVQIAVDAENRPHIVYTPRVIGDSLTNPKQTLYATKVDGEWWLETADRTSYATGWEPDIAVDFSGRPHLAYSQIIISHSVPPGIQDGASAVSRGIMYATPAVSLLPIVEQS